MTDTPEADSPRVPEAFTNPHVPEGAHTGAAAREVIRTALSKRTEHEFSDPDVIEQVLKSVEEWQRAVTPGKPVLRIGLGAHGTTLQGGGVALGPVYTETEHDTVWGIYVPMQRRDYGGNICETSAYISLYALAHAAAHSEPTEVWLTDEAEVAAYFVRMGKTLTDMHNRAVDVKAVATFLNTVGDTTIPFSSLHIDEATRIDLCNRLLDALTLEDTHEHLMLHQALCYAADIHEPEQIAAMYDVIEDQWADFLPLARGDDATALRGIEQLLEFHPIPSELLASLPEGFEIDSDMRGHVLRAHFLADLYERRAAHEQAKGVRSAGLQLPDAVAPLDTRPLQIFMTDYPHSDHVRADIAYVRALRAAGRPVTQEIERNQELMNKGIRALAEFAMTTPDAVDRLTAFDAMEYLFDLQTELQRDELYRLLTERFALTVPFTSQEAFDGHIGVAEAMGELMPFPPVATDGTVYVGAARVAAMMGRLYRRRAAQRLAMQLRRYKPLEENED